MLMGVTTISTYNPGHLVVELYSAHIVQMAEQSKQTSPVLGSNVCAELNERLEQTKKNYSPHTLTL